MQYVKKKKQEIGELAQEDGEVIMLEVLGKKDFVKLVKSPKLQNCDKLHPMSQLSLYLDPPPF